MSLLTVNDAIHGWSPAGDDDIEVSVSQDMCFMSINPITSSSALLSHLCPPLDTTLPRTFSPPSKSIPLIPLSDLTRTAIAPSSDRRAQRNRNRDPNWIPRPRNAFIIFRCEYSREHAQGSQEPQDDTTDDSSATVKTLSKRAAEAWRKLPLSERERYKILADMEREEHARLYPHYRFRPMKRQVSGTRKSSCERSRSPKTTPPVEGRSASSTSLPSVLAAAPEKSRSNPSVERAEVSASKPQATAAQAPAPLPEPPSNPPDSVQTNTDLSLGVDSGDPLLFYPSPETSLPSGSSSPSASAELCSPSVVSIPLDTFHCNDTAFSLDLTRENLERAQALEAYAIGLYNHDLFSPFSFPEYY